MDGGWGTAQDEDDDDVVAMPDPARPPEQRSGDGDDVIDMPDPAAKQEIRPKTSASCKECDDTFEYTPPSTQRSASSSEYQSQSEGTSRENSAHTLIIPTPTEFRDGTERSSEPTVESLSEEGLSIRLNDQHIIQTAEEWKSRPATRQKTAERDLQTSDSVSASALSKFYPHSAKQEWLADDDRSRGKSTVSEVTEYESEYAEDEERSYEDVGSSEGSYETGSDEEDEEEEEDEDEETLADVDMGSYETPRTSNGSLITKSTRGSDLVLFLDDQQINTNAKNWEGRPTSKQGIIRPDSMESLGQFYPPAATQNWANADKDYVRKMTLAKAKEELFQWGKKAKRIMLLREQASYDLASRGTFAKEIQKLRHFTAEKLQTLARKALGAAPAKEEALAFLQRAGKDAVENRYYYSLRPPQRIAKKELIKLGRHALRRDEALWHLVRTGQQAAEEREARLLGLEKKRSEAFSALQSLGQRAIEDLPRLIIEKHRQSAQHTLAKKAKKALAQLQIQETTFNELRGYVFRYRQQEALGALQKRAQKGLEHWDRRLSTLKLLKETGVKAIHRAVLDAMGKQQREAVEYLQQKGLDALAKHEKRCDAFDFLFQKGQGRIKHLNIHNQNQEKARAFLSQRAMQGIAHFHKKSSIIFPELSNMGKDARIKVARDESQYLLSSLAKKEKTNARRNETFELLQCQGSSATVKQAELHQRQKEVFEYLSELGQRKAQERWDHIQRTLMRRKKAFEYLLMWAERAHNSFSLVDARADAVAELQEAARRSIAHLAAQEENFAWLCDLAQHGAAAIEKLKAAKQRMKLVQKKRTKQAWAPQMKHNRHKAKNMRIHVIQSGKAQSIVFPKKKGPPKAIHRNPRLPHVMELIKFERVTGYEYQGETREEIRMLIDRQSKGLVPAGLSVPSLRRLSQMGVAVSPKNSHITMPSSFEDSGLCPTRSFQRSNMANSQESFPVSPAVGSPLPSRQGRRQPTHRSRSPNRSSRSPKRKNRKKKKKKRSTSPKAKPRGKTPERRSGSPLAQQRRPQSPFSPINVKQAWNQHSARLDEKTQFMKQYSESKYANSLYSAISRSESYLDAHVQYSSTSYNEGPEAFQRNQFSRPASKTVGAKPMLAFSEAQIKRKNKAGKKLKPIRRMDGDIIEMRALGEQMIM